MNTRARLETNITFLHMHAGCIAPFHSALYDALELPKHGPQLKIYGMAKSDEGGKIYDFRDGRAVAFTGTMNNRPPYYYVVCEVEGDFERLVAVCPANDELHWDKVEFLAPEQGEESLYASS
jgi:hypothetical protein